MRKGIIIARQVVFCYSLTGEFIEPFTRAPEKTIQIILNLDFTVTHRRLDVAPTFD